MNPYAVGFGVGVGVGLIYERDLEKAIERSAFTTSLAAFLQTTTGKRVLIAGAGVAVGLAKDVAIVTTAAASTSTAGALATIGTYGAAVAAGYVIGAATGTAISSVAFGPEGKQKAIDFYTFQNTKPIDYLPHYNAYKIIKHYVSN